MTLLTFAFLLFEDPFYVDNLHSSCIVYMFSFAFTFSKIPVIR